MTAIAMEGDLAKSALHRGVGVALWRQIGDEIRRGIGAGLEDENGRLPPEAELAARFGVNRHTVRAAIAALIHEGVLRSEQGRGTYVRRQKRLTYPIGARTRFSAGLEGQVRERQIELLGHTHEPATATIATALDLRPSEDVIRLEMRGLADGVPVSRSTAWFPAARFPDIASYFAEKHSITEALALSGINDYRRASIVVEARHADDTDTRDLKLSPGAIVLVARGINVDGDGRPIQYSQTRFSADRVELTVSAG